MGRMMSASPKFCILGAGAIGGLIATLLARSGATVSAVARGQTLAALNRDGVRLIINGEMLQASIRVSEDPSELGVQDYVIIAVKVPSLPGIARRIDPLLGPETAVVTAMNGVPWWFFLNAWGALAGHKLRAIDPDGAIGQAIATRRVVGCVVHVAASVDEPGVIRHNSGRQLLVGEPDHQLTPRLAHLADWLRRAGFDCRESLDIQRDIWFKLWGNLSRNPISLLTAATSDRIIDDPLVRRLCVSIMEETATHDIGLLIGVPTPFIDSVLGLARLRANSMGLLDRAA